MARTPENPDFDQKVPDLAQKAQRLHRISKAVRLPATHLSEMIHHAAKHIARQPWLGWDAITPSEDETKAVTDKLDEEGNNFAHRDP